MRDPAFRTQELEGVHLPHVTAGNSFVEELREEEPNCCCRSFCLPAKPMPITMKIGGARAIMITLGVDPCRTTEAVDEVMPEAGPGPA